MTTPGSALLAAKRCVPCRGGAQPLRGVELAALLARSGQARDCVPTQWLRYALGREEEEEDTCSLVALRQAFETSGGDMRELMVALTQTDAFMSYRQPE